MPFVGIDTQIGTCMFSGLDEDGFPVAQVDANGEDSQVAPGELHHPFGFASRPVDPDLDASGQLKPGGGCTLFYSVDGDGQHMWLGYDPRYLTLMPRLKKGGSMQYCSWGSFGIYDGDDGTFTQYVPVEKDASGTVTKAHAITVGVDGNGDALISIVHADGMALVLHQKKTILKNAAGDAYLELSGSGAVLNGNTRLNGGLVVGDAAVALTRYPELAALLTEFATAVDAATLAASKAQTPPPTLSVVTPLLAAMQTLFAKSS